MPRIEDLIQEAADLPVEERARVIDHLLRSLNPPDPELERESVDLAQARLSELRSGRVQAIPGDEVFSRIKKRFAR